MLTSTVQQSRGINIQLVTETEASHILKTADCDYSIARLCLLILWFGTKSNTNPLGVKNVTLGLYCRQQNFIVDNKWGKNLFGKQQNKLPDDWLSALIHQLQYVIRRTEMILIITEGSHFYQTHTKSCQNVIFLSEHRSDQNKPIIFTPLTLNLFLRLLGLKDFVY